MNLLYLKYFQTVALNESITQAAQILYIPQPALSKAIASIEQEIGTKLFDRKGRRIVLNESGKLFLQHVNIALSSLENAKKELDTIKNGSFPDLILNSDAYFDGLSLLMASFHKEYPQIKFMLRKENTRQTYPLRKYDAAFIMQVSGAEPMDCSHVLFEEKLFLAIPNDPNHPLFQCDSIDLHDLSKFEFVSFRMNSEYRNMIETYCKFAGFSPKITIEATDCRMLCDFVRAGLGVSIVPELSWHKLYAGLKLIPINAGFCSRKLLLTWFDDDRLNKSSRLFIDFCKQWFSPRGLTEQSFNPI